jgi:hypothetical protein
MATFGWKDQPIDIRQIARDLGGHSIPKQDMVGTISGSPRQSCAVRFHVWSASHDHPRIPATDPHRHRVGLRRLDRLAFAHLRAPPSNTASGRRVSGTANWATRLLPARGRGRAGTERVRPGGQGQNSVACWPCPKNGTMSATARAPYRGSITRYHGARSRMQLSNSGLPGSPRPSSWHPCSISAMTACRS